MEWGNRSIDDVLEAQRVRDPHSDEIEETPPSHKWRCGDAFDCDLKNVGTVALRQLADPMMLRINQGWSVEERAREGVKALEQNNRYWPEGR